MGTIVDTSKIFFVMFKQSVVVYSLLDLSSAKKHSERLAEYEVVKRFGSYIPKFTDIFDEETFYIFFFVLVIVCLVGAFLCSRYVNIRDAYDSHKD